MSSEKTLPMFIAALLLGAAASAQDPVSLRRAYDWAVDRDEALKSQRKDIDQSQAQARAAIGGALPQLDWNWTDTYQDPSGVDKLVRQGLGDFVQKNQVESKISLKQPLFSGLREWSAWSGFLRETSRDEALYRRGARLLFQRTADAYYDVLGHEADRANAAAALALSRDRLRELRGFLRLGKSRPSEVFTAEARVASFEGQLEHINGQIAASRQDLSLVTGQDLTDAPLDDDPSVLPSTGPLEAELSALHDRSDLRAQRDEVEAQRLRVRYERGGRWPTADVTGTYYFQRPAFMSDLTWDVMLELKMPLFHGGSIDAAIKQAKAARDQAQLSLEEKERAAAHDVRTLHDQLAAALRESRALDAAAQAAQKSYDALQGEYRLGLVTNLEVLEALDFLQAQKNARDAARINAKRLDVKLGVAVERLP